MSNSTAIAAVTSTLRALLEQELPGIAVEETRPPVDLSASTALIGVYLYRVEHNAFTANLDWHAVGDTRLDAAPFGLNLHYLITPYGTDELEIQRLLGEVLRTFRERAVILPGDPVLAAPLATMTEELRIVPRMLPLAEMLDLWRAFDRVAYRLCITYEVSVVLLDDRRSRDIRRVQERVVDVEVMR